MGSLHLGLFEATLLVSVMSIGAVAWGVSTVQVVGRVHRERRSMMIAAVKSSEGTCSKRSQICQAVLARLDLAAAASQPTFSVVSAEDHRAERNQEHYRRPKLEHSEP